MRFFNVLFTTGLLILLVILLVAGTWTVQNRMNTIREERDLTATSIAENAPPAIAFTTMALGSFRGLVADALWLKSRQAKQNGNYFEMYQLASWIVKLQPRFTLSTAYLAWNMSYNVSVTFDSFEDRWRWVQRGIELIRDEALKYNPGDPRLFRELGWIYQHKLGQEMDKAQRLYKYKLAQNLMNIFGTYPPDWEKWEETPETVEGLKQGDEKEEIKKFLNFLQERNWSVKKLYEEFTVKNGTFPDLIADKLNDLELTEQIDRFLRVKWLKDEYKLYPAKIREINRKYGKLDWRSPEAQAIYWASKGLEKSEDKVNLDCERMIFQALNTAFENGRIVYLGGMETVETMPNINIVDATKRAYERTMEKHPKNRGVESGYENFLIDATVILYTFGEEQKAKEYHETIREIKGKDKVHPSLSQFVLEKLAGDLEASSYDRIMGTVQSYLFRAYYNVALDAVERAAGFEKVAKRIYTNYMKSLGDSGEVRRGLPPYSQMKRNMADRTLQRLNDELSARLKASLGEFEAAPELEQSAESK